MAKDIIGANKFVANEVLSLVYDEDEKKLKVLDSSSDLLAALINTIGSQNKLEIQDTESINILNNITTELKIMNMHLSMITDNTITKEDVE